MIGFKRGLICSFEPVMVGYAISGLTSESFRRSRDLRNTLSVLGSLHLYNLAASRNPPAFRTLANQPGVPAMLPPRACQGLIAGLPLSRNTNRRTGAKTRLASGRLRSPRAPRTGRLRSHHAICFRRSLPKNLAPLHCTTQSRSCYLSSITEQFLRLP